MLHILWTILKIIGIILLVILGILILLSLIVNFVPARYRIEAQSKGNLKTTSLHAKFSWMLHVVSGQVVYENEELEWKVRIGWKMFPAIKPEVKEITVKESQKAEKQDDSKAEKTKEETPEQETLKEESKPETKKETQKRGLLEKIKYTIQKICDKIKSIIGIKDKIISFLKNEVHAMAFGRLKKEVFRLAKFLKPKKIKGQVHFGMEDPYVTGQILALLSVLYPFYGENVEILPDFEQKVLEGNLYMKGHIRGIYVVIFVWNLIFDKNVRTAFRNIKALK